MITGGNCAAQQYSGDQLSSAQAREIIIDSLFNADSTDPLSQVESLNDHEQNRDAIIKPGAIREINIAAHLSAT
jgi:hypothetical protein